MIQILLRRPHCLQDADEDTNDHNYNEAFGSFLPPRHQTQKEGVPKGEAVRGEVVIVDYRKLCKTDNMIYLAYNISSENVLDLGFDNSTASTLRMLPARPPAPSF
jgi:hypothetical protein